MKLIDTHSHLYDEAFDDDRAKAVSRAREAGIEAVFLPATDSESYGALFDMVRDYPDFCFPMMGLHPTSVNDNPRWRGELDLVEKYLIEKPAGRFYAIGEVGLDLYWSKDFRKEQMAAFERQVELSLKYDLPLVIHTRDAWPEMIACLTKYKSRAVRGIMHSFSGTLDEYRTICDIGDFVFGIGGPVTYKKSLLAAVVAEMDMDRIVLETDCPYLPPVPFRGKRNESSYLKYICEKVAEIKAVSIDEVAEITTATACGVFGT